MLMGERQVTTDFSPDMMNRHRRSSEPFQWLTTDALIQQIGHRKEVEGIIEFNEAECPHTSGAGRWCRNRFGADGPNRSRVVVRDLEYQVVAELIDTTPTADPGPQRDIASAESVALNEGLHSLNG